MTDSVMDRLVTELGRTGIVVGALPPSPTSNETVPWIVGRRLHAHFERDGSIRMTAPVILTATNIEQLVRQLEALPPDSTFALEMA